MDIDIRLYRRYLQEIVQEAFDNSDRTKAGMANYLTEKKLPRRFTMHRREKSQALVDACKAFDEHRHWPLEIILSHLGVEVKQ